MTEQEPEPANALKYVRVRSKQSECVAFFNVGKTHFEKKEGRERDILYGWKRRGDRALFVCVPC